ncbi:MAG: hypothetical protein UW64_C0015G0005 [Microgenomates group bacterium GW2011_GWC1_44_37]|uniref:Uncharacterized protein n=1 Tax=Candidatus Collierbacteria bacterium GW2011_GWB2_44_22 TaxID=1618387 RepID=A0A0G1HY93_9BACT|nr:MAG: hypothetical protein UW31_C0005G0093 [Candidatus Collierbacteria bacterium GW2011_GWA2_44_13]KKT51583.1 MAG: hypothetical protein UW44_C0010G0021 [Candidatus Collierbacteria bacterium GW2011_GWB2_44_22]KKT63034.1 MAG: hypothetical protein UW56_C0002G0019 [Candidatus Collierbacteria bacterium GW2011_GWD1_44_27]KKT65845.1 MAG: hypothetical protein UW58_C0018G0019 [Candidatus Collierbacteria bacterium GW2011_GWC2_44_30]KKT68581.1 MAG: hypothetical protein UW64_C0015G0005 [Microgenomates gr
MSSFLDRQNQLISDGKKVKALQQIQQIAESGKPIKWEIPLLPILLILILATVVIGSVVAIRDYYSPDSPLPNNQNNSQPPSLPEAPSLPEGSSIDPSWPMNPIAMGAYQTPTQIFSDISGIPGFTALSTSPGRLVCQDGYAAFYIPPGTNNVYILAVDPSGVIVYTPPVPLGWVNIYCDAGTFREIIVFSQ